MSCFTAHLWYYCALRMHKLIVFVVGIDSVEGGVNGTWNKIYVYLSFHHPISVTSEILDIGYPTSGTNVMFTIISLSSPKYLAIPRLAPMKCFKNHPIAAINEILGFPTSGTNVYHPITVINFTSTLAIPRLTPMKHLPSHRCHHQWNTWLSPIWHQCLPSHRCHQWHTWLFHVWHQC